LGPRIMKFMQTSHLISLEMVVVRDLNDFKHDTVDCEHWGVIYTSPEALCHVSCSVNV